MHQLRSIIIPDSVMTWHLGIDLGSGLGTGLERLQRITLPANLDITFPGGQWSSDVRFYNFYRSNNRRAGTYVHNPRGAPNVPFISMFVREWSFVEL